MEEMDYSQEDYSGMTATSWVRNRKAIIRMLSENKYSLGNFREKLLAEKQGIEEEVEGIEQESFSLRGKVRDLETRHLEKNNTLQKLKSQLRDSRGKLVKPLTEKNGHLSELKFLESEKARLFELNDTAAETLNNNMATLGSTIMEIEFIRGEISTLINKAGMVEENIPELVSEVQDLDEKISRASKALTDLYNNIKTVEKNAKILYYEKE